MESEEDKGEGLEGGEVWLDRERGEGLPEPDLKRSGVQRDESRGEGTDGTGTRTLGKRRNGRERGRDLEIPREPLRRPTQKTGGGGQR